MTIYKNLLARGYLPKELPPSFFSDHFAAYATSKAGRAVLSSYKPSDNFTECVSYRLALPGLNHRLLRIPHPYSYSKLARITAKNFRRLLQKAGKSPFSKSRPVYQVRQRRALRTLVKPSNLARERALSRGGSSHLLKVDVSQFYPSLYTHAVGWAVDPKLRERANWSKKTLVGKQLDQALMDLQGKVSQGIPIGTDLSFLLAETVLSQVDRSIDIGKSKAYRWFDDYEFACDTREEAERILSSLQRELDSYRLRLNPKKTQIIELPQPASDGWHDVIIDASKSAFSRPHAMVKYFDNAFSLASEHPELPILLYAIGALFQNHKPWDSVLRVAESCISQAMLREPGCAQKGLSLLQFWQINGCPIDRNLWAHTTEQIIQRHERSGASSDVAWALAFCIAQTLPISKKAGRILASLNDDVISIQALHADSLGLVHNFSKSGIEKFLANSEMDGNHWLAIYESVRHGFLPSLTPKVTSSKLMNDMLGKGVTFYRPSTPSYSLVIHSGGAPDWITQKWINTIITTSPEKFEEIFAGNSMLALLGEGLRNIAHQEKNEIEILLDLMGIEEPETAVFEPYA